MRRPRHRHSIRRLHRCGALRVSSRTTIRLIVFLALLAGPAILLAPALLPGRALLPADLLVQFEPWKSQISERPQANWDPLVWDGIAQYYPWRHFAAKSLRAGHIPLWNPYQFCGTPFLANGQSAMLYPLNLIFWLLPVARSFGWSALLHLFLAGWFAYLFLRRTGVGRVGSVAGGIVWQLNSFFIAWLHLPTVICTATWLPIILLFCDRAIVTGRARHAIAAGIALALSYLGGHPQMFLFVALLAAAYLIARAACGAGWQPAPGAKPLLPRPLLRYFSAEAPSPRRVGHGLAPAIIHLLKVSAITASFTLALAAAQLLPTLDLLHIAHRAFTPGPESYKAFLSRALPAPLLSNLLLPHPFGHPNTGTYVGPENYAEYCSYIGIIALAFAIYAAFAVRTWHNSFFAIAAILAILVAIGTPLNWPLYHWLPGMSGAGGPARIIILAVFSLSILAGTGIDHSLRGAGWQPAQGTKPLPSSAGRPRGPVRQELAPVLIAILLALLLGAWWLFGAPAVSQSRPMLLDETNAEALRAAVLIAIAIALTALFRSPRLRAIAPIGLVIILAADLILAAQHHAHIVPQQWVYAADANPGPAAGRILGNASDWPLNRFPNAVSPPNAATVYGLRDAFGYDSLYLAHYRDFASLIQGADPSPPLNGNLLLARLGQTYGLDMLSIAGVGEVYSPTPVRGLTIERSGLYDTYRNQYARPRAWLTGSSVTVATHQEAVAALAKLGAFHDWIVITGDDRGDLAQPLLEPAPEARVRDLSPNRVIVDLSRGGGGYLFLADTYAPGWHAYAAGRELPILTADVTFRAVPLTQDVKSVEFRYEPGSFRVGLFVALIAFAALGAAAFFGRARQR